MNLPSMNVLGLMSGTSLDGVDAVLGCLELREGRLHWQVLERESLAYPVSLRERLLRAIKPESSDVLLITQVHTELGHVYAELVSAVQQRSAVDLVALSGQTIYHIPRLDAARGWQTVSTLQIGEAAIVAERCAIPVVSDFRQSDMAAGGQGAPLVSFGDFVMFGETGKAKALHNLGGISNLTYLPASGNPAEVFAFDTGPANCLIDEAVKRYFGLEFDEAGKFASKGNVDSDLLGKLMQHPYFSLPIPKTTGREVFTYSELEQDYALSKLEPHDLIATLTAFTAQSIIKAYKDHVLARGLAEILVAGGGVLNPVLMGQLQAGLECPVYRFEKVGLQAKDREALAFAVMAYYAYHNLPNTLAQATGANHAVSAGKLTRKRERFPTHF